MATVYSGGTYANTTFVGGTRQNIQAGILAQLIVAGWTSVAQASGQGPGNVGTVTMTIASPGVITFAGHGFLGGERVILQTTGALPTGLSVNTVYFVKAINSSTFNLATTLGGANINTSGSQSGTHTLNAESVLMQSATQANVTNPICVRLKDNRLNCLQISIENQAGSVVGGSGSANGGMLLPATAKVFKIIATKYHFYCFTTGSSVAREFVMAGMLNVPTVLTGITDHGYVVGNCTSDSVTTLPATIQTQTGTSGSTPNTQFIWNTNIWEFGNNPSTGNGAFWPLIPNSALARGLRWANDALNGADVLVTAGLTSGGTDEGKIKGQLYDIIFIGKQSAKDLTDTRDGHTWYNLSDNVAAGSFWVATS